MPLKVINLPSERDRDSESLKRLVKEEASEPVDDGKVDKGSESEAGEQSSTSSHKDQVGRCHQHRPGHLPYRVETPILRIFDIFVGYPFFTGRADPAVSCVVLKLLLWP